MKLFIKNMVRDRCIRVVKAELEKLDLHPVNIKLGEAELSEKELLPEQTEKTTSALTLLGFEIMDDRKSRIIEKIKNVIVQLVCQLLMKPYPLIYQTILLRNFTTTIII